MLLVRLRKRHVDHFGAQTHLIICNLYIFTDFPSPDAGRDVVFYA